MKMIDKKNVKKILVIRNDKIGDLAYASGIIKEIKKYSPNVEVGVVVSPENKNLIEKNKYVSDVFVSRYKPKNLKDVLNYFKVAKQIRKKQFDIGFDLRGQLTNIFFLMFLGNVRYKAGFDRSFLGNVFLNFPYKRNFKIHECITMWDMVSNSLGYPRTTPWPDIATDKNDEKDVDDFIKSNKIKKFVCFVPDATTQSIQWPLERWDKVIKYMKQNYPDYKIILTGGNMEKIKWIEKRNSYTIILDQKINKNLRAVYLLFKKSSLVMSQEGGPMVLAWASKTNTLSLRDICNPNEHTLPLGKNAINIYKEIKKISVKEVEKVISNLLEKNK